MRERPIGGRPGTAMEWLVDFLNLDFDSTCETEKQKMEGLIGEWRFPPDKPKAAATVQSAKRLQTRLVHFLTPVLISDPDQVAQQRTAVLKGMMRVSKQTGMPQEEIDGLNRQVQKLQHLTKRQLEAERESGLRQLVEVLTEWGKSGAARPYWQLEKEGVGGFEPEPGQQVYRIGGKRFFVLRRDWVDGIWNKGLMTLASCLVSGQLERLRNCVHCSKFFFAQDFRKKFCTSECQKARDQKAAVERMTKWRKKKETELKTYALKILPKLSQRQFEAPLLQKLQTVLGESGRGALDSMLQDMADGIPKDKVWARGSSRKRALFRKLQLAGIN